MRIRSFIIAYALVLALLLFADRRPSSSQQDRYSHVVDLTEAENSAALPTAPSHGTRIISPAALIPGTWTAGQIPAERLVAPLVVLNLKAAQTITLEEIADWESRNGPVPQGAFVAIRNVNVDDAPRDRAVRNTQPGSPLPITAGAAQFLMDARYVLGFAIEAPVDLTADRTLARQLALHGDYVVERAARLAALPETGSLVIVAPAKSKNAAEAPVRILAMVK